MIQIIDIELLVPFENHPFKERSGIEQLYSNPLSCPLFPVRQTVRPNDARLP